MVVLGICVGFTCMAETIYIIGHYGWIPENVMFKFTEDCLKKSGTQFIIKNPPVGTTSPLEPSVYGGCECLPGYVWQNYYNPDTQEDDERCVPQSIK